MKTYKMITSAVLAAMFLSGCGTQSGTITTITAPASETEGEASAIVSETAEETSVEAETEAAAAEETSEMEETISELFARNIVCSVYAFGSGGLAWGGEPVSGDNIYKVSDERFSSYSDFESFIRSTYCKDTADMLLYNYPYEGTQLYVDVDGMLCIDSNLSGSKGYYVDWTDTKITIDSLTDDRCEFTAAGSITEPADVPVAEEYKVSCTAVYENGSWLLTDFMA